MTRRACERSDKVSLNPTISNLIVDFDLRIIVVKGANEGKKDQGSGRLQPELDVG